MLLKIYGVLELHYVAKGKSPTHMIEAVKVV